MFDPKTNKFPYTEYTDQHYLKVEYKTHYVFDENYPYLDTSKKQKRRARWVRFLLYLIVFPVYAVKMGLRIRGRKNLKKHKEYLKDGAISVSNHVHMCDYICIMNALRHRKTNILVWAPNVNGESGKLIRSVGGIPIPEESMAATKAYIRAVGNLLNDHGWLHICSEGSMWEYYYPIRPFKKGAAHFAFRYNKPIVPIGFSYRKPGWIRRKIFKQIALFNVTIGEPLYIDQTLPKDEQIYDLTKRSHDAVCLLSGINPQDNIYEPVFNHDKRIDYYTTEYGVGYKKSRK